MVYKWYILPIGGLYATYHLLGERETTIDIWSIISKRWAPQKLVISRGRCLKSISFGVKYHCSETLFFFGPSQGPSITPFITIGERGPPCKKLQHLLFHVNNLAMLTVAIFIEMNKLVAISFKQDFVLLSGCNYVLSNFE